MTRPIVLCADDYALTPAISRAILDLARRKRISALSCMTASRHWPEHGPWLQGVSDKVDIGLHVTLVDEAPLTAMPNTAPHGRLPDVGSLIIKSYLGALDLGEIEAEIEAQRSAFERVMGFPPQHIDGHLHTHVLPGIRDVVLKMAHAMTPRPWIRNIAESYSAIMKRGVAVPKASFLAALGKGLARAGKDERMNEGFSGIYGLSPSDGAYGDLFAHFVEATSDRHLILCHPGAATDRADHAPTRAGEYDFLMSDAFPRVLAQHDLRVGRFAEAAS